MAAASVTASLTLTCILQQIIYLPSGDYGVVFNMVDAGGNVKRTHSWVAKADGSAVLDEFGNVIGTPPAALITAIGNVKTNIDAALGNAATAGKIPL